MKEKEMREYNRSPNTLAEKCNKVGIKYATYHWRRRKGMTHEEALNTPKKEHIHRTAEEKKEARNRTQRRRQRRKRKVPEEFIDLPREELTKKGFLKQPQIKIFLLGEALKDFCEKRGLKYNTVYMYIKRRGLKKAEKFYGKEQDND